MTREEAIGTMNYLKHYAETDIKERDVLEEKDRTRFIEAVEMAIKALSQEPKYRMAYDYTDGKLRKFAWIWGNGWTEIEQEPICDRDCEHCTWTECPIEPCDDAISRDAVLKMAYDMSEIDGEHFTEPCMVVDVEDIQKLPPVTQKSGKWDASCTCSVCGQWKILESEKNGGKYKFCPNCGAKMESEDKE